MLEYFIKGVKANFEQRANFGFNTWARKEPGDYLAIYPKLMKDFFKDNPEVKLKMSGIVDDVLPKIVFRRSEYEQSAVNDQFAEKMHGYGFNEVHFVSKSLEKIQIAQLVELLNRFTYSDFDNVLPEVKKVGNPQIPLNELFEFIWQVRVLQLFLDEKDIDGFVTGIRTERFYLAARKVLPDHSLFFAKKNR